MKKLEIESIDKLLLSHLLTTEPFPPHLHIHNNAYELMMFKAVIVSVLSRLKACKNSIMVSLLRVICSTRCRVAVYMTWAAMRSAFVFIVLIIMVIVSGPLSASWIG